MTDWLFPDLCVIGAGAGGIAAAERAARLGASVILVEKQRFGGDGLHVGAVPALGLVEAARHMHALQEAESFGIDVDPPRPVFRRVHARIDGLVRALSPASAAPRLAALGITTLAGEGRFVDRRTLIVGDIHIRAHRFLVATGSQPLTPALLGLTQVPYFTTDTILDNTRKLSHLLIEGATPLTLELAQSYRRLGSEVTVVDPAQRLLPDLDEDMAELLRHHLMQEGVRLLESTVLVELLSRSMGIGARVRNANGEAVLDISHVLIATPRRPRIDGMGLELARVDRAKGDPTRLRLKRNGRTTNPRVFALGGPDGTDSVTAARAQGAALAEAALLGTARKLDLEALPLLVRTDPALASVGLSLAAATRKYGPGRIEVLRASYAGNDRALATGHADGLVRVIAGPGDRLLGATILGPEAGELAALFSLALNRRMRVAELHQLLVPYGTYAGVIETLGQSRAAAQGRPVARAIVAARRKIRRLLSPASQRR